MKDAAVLAIRKGAPLAVFSGQFLNCTFISSRIICRGKTEIRSGAQMERHTRIACTRSCLGPKRKRCTFW